MKNISNVPMRRCCGCNQSFPKAQLIKVAGRDGQACIDMADRAAGRGVYVCKNNECIKQAERRRAIGRNLHTELSKELLEQLFQEMRDMVAATGKAGDFEK